MNGPSDKAQQSQGERLAPIISLAKWKREKARRFESLVKRAERAVDSRRKSRETSEEPPREKP